MKTNLFLTVTAGRTGTGYVHRLCGMLPNTHSDHESDIPQGKHYWDKKIKHIESLNVTNYIETSHLLCKGWLEPLIERRIIPNIIILQRSARDIAKSFFQLNTIPGRTTTGNIYGLTPNVNTLTQIDSSTLTDYELCYWYCLEIEERQRYYKKMIEELNGKTFTTSVALLKEIEHFKLFLSFLNIEPTDNIINNYFSLRNNNVNLKLNQKQHFPLPNKKLEESENKVIQLIQK